MNNNLLRRLLTSARTSLTRSVFQTVHDAVRFDASLETRFSRTSLVLHSILFAIGLYLI
jgi:hypothetical protein